MKNKLYLTICLIIGLQLNLNAQNVTQSKVELNKVLCKKWVPDYALMGGMKINQLPSNLAFELEFNSDNSYFVIKEKKKQKGEWSQNTSKKYIELAINNKITSRITKISETEFILVLVSDGKNDPPGLPSMEIHFKN